MATITIEKLLKHRSQGTKKAVKELLEGYEPESLITDLFVTTSNPNALILIKQFEKQLVLSKIDFDRFQKGLHSFYKENAKYIAEQKLYKEFYEFVYFILNKFIDGNQDVYSAYMCLLMQQSAYFSPAKIVYGVTTNGDVLTTDEAFPKSDYGMIEFEETYGHKGLNLGFKAVKPFMQKYGYHYNSVEEMYRDSLHEQLINNMLFTMVNFIDETNKDMLPIPYFLPSYGASFPRQWKSTEFYKEKLKTRENLLNRKGVLVKLKNAKDITEVLFKEKIYEDKIVMLYKAKLDDGNSEGYITGFYDNSSQLFHSVWKTSSGEQTFHSSFENFVLELYSHLVCNIENDAKRFMALKIVEDINDNSITYFDEQPVAEFLTYKNNGNNNTEGKSEFIKFDKSKYKDSYKQINPYVRKLPMGMSASAEAIERARKLGYEIKAGETFVKNFKKKVYTKE